MFVCQALFVCVFAVVVVVLAVVVVVIVVVFVVVGELSLHFQYNSVAFQLLTITYAKRKRGNKRKFVINRRIELRAVDIVHFRATTIWCLLSFHLEI